MLRTGAVVVLFSISFLSFSQPAGDEIKTQNEKMYSEELLVQTDRDIYIAGEQLFFKIYKLNGLTRTPGNISKVVYVELLDAFNNQVEQVKIAVDGFSGSGGFRLPDTLSTGNYLIRSYTNWMKNFSTELFSYKRVSVINPFGNINKIKLAVIDEQPDSVLFFPESGSIVAGIESVVGYRCFKMNGDPVAVKGIVIDSNSDTLCMSQTDNNGYGKFSVKPADNGNLYLVIGKDKNEIKRFALPVVKSSGVTFSVNTGRDNDFFKINIRKNLDSNDIRSKVYIVCSPVSTAPVTTEIIPEKDTEILLKKNTLPPGLVMLTVTDENGLPLAKRWIYNDKTETTYYGVKFQNAVYPTRGKVKIDITATDTDGRSVKSDLLVSVVKSFSTDKNNYGNFPGYRQLPTVAMLSMDCEKNNLNDYLIFYTNGDDILDSKKYANYVTPEYLPELGGLLVTGNIKNTTTGEPMRKENIVLSLVGKSALCKFSKTDDNGYFNFVINERGSTEIVIQPLSLISDYYVELNNPFSESFSTHTHLPFYPDSSKMAEINSAIISMQIKNIYDPFLKNKTNPIIIDKSDFFGEPDMEVLMSNYIELTSLKEAIKEIVPGVSIYKENDRSNIRLVNETMDKAFDTDPLVIVDGVPINDIDKILTMDLKDLEKIEVLKDRYFVSDITIEGIIHLITKEGNLSAFEFDRTTFRQEFEASQPAGKFISPDYSVDSLKNSRIPDFRNTLYWNPDIMTDSEGKASVEFYTSDESGEYTVIVEGITSDGKTGKSEISFLVTGE